MKFRNSKFFASIFILFSAILVLYLGFNLRSQKQDIRNKAAGTEVNFSIYPSTQNLNLNETKTFDVMADFTNGSVSEKLNYVSLSISFTKENLFISPGRYIDTSKSGLEKVIRVDGPVVANSTGVINIELGAISSTSGPNTGTPLRVAQIYLTGKSVTSASQYLTITKAQVVNAQSANLPVKLGRAAYTIAGSANVSPSISVSALTPTSSPTTPVIVTPSLIIIPTLTPTPIRPFNSPTPYNLNRRFSPTTIPTVTIKIAPPTPSTYIFPPTQIPTISVNPMYQNSAPTSIPPEQPPVTEFVEAPSPTIQIPDYATPAPAKPSNPLAGFFSFLFNIFCGIFRSCK